VKLPRARRWPFLLVLGGGVAGFAFLWYASLPAEEGSEPAFGGRYVEGVAGSPSRINPLFAPLNAVDQSLVSLVFAGLTGLDDQGRPFPALAESWQVSPDGLVYTFRLRPGLVWQDGEPLTAADVVFTYELLSNPAVGAPNALVDVFAGASIVRVDDRTVQFELRQPFAPLPAYLSLGLLPGHLLARTAPEEIVNSPFNLGPVGAGPYRLEEVTRDHAVLTANPLFYRGQPYLQQLELRFYHDDGALIAALAGQEVSGALLSAGVSSEDVFELEHEGDLQVDLLPGPEVAVVYLNLSDPLFQDARLRRALLYALDRDALIEELLGGQALRADSPLGVGGWAVTATLAAYDYDPAAAAGLLDEAGWLLGEAGSRSREGRELAFTLATNSDPVRVAVAEALADAWGEVGIQVTVEVLGATELVRDRLEPRAYEAALFAYQTEIDPDPLALWHSAAATTEGRNLGSLSDSRVDALLEQGRLAADPEVRRALYQEFEELFAAELPALPLYVPTQLYVHETSLRGVRLGLQHGPGARFWQVASWYVRTR
jgi:peptide/nickel transport system substrate-binding protein